MEFRAGLDAWFVSFAAFLSRWSGNPLVFAAAAASILAWAICGPLFDYSEGWMLTVNTGTTIITFLMVFIIQNSQNRDGLAVQIKLDEIIRAIHGARNNLIDLENLPQKELDDLRLRFAAIGLKARKPAKRLRKTRGAA